MRNLWKCAIGMLVCGQMLSLIAVAQQRGGQTTPANPQKTLLDKLNTGQAAEPAPKKDIVGFWAGGIMARLNPIPAMTPEGQAAMKANKNDGQFSIIDSNDPFKNCDPLGFPRSVLFMTRGLAFAQMPDRMLQLNQYNRTWREIFTDGRKLPEHVGDITRDLVVDPWHSTWSESTAAKWFGYSVGHWEGDYTFVVNSVGTKPETWMTNSGLPHSGDLKVEERYTRVDKNTLELTVQIDDPKMYTKSFQITKSTFKWIPAQDFEEQICVPSEGLEYLRLLDPNGKSGEGVK